MKRLLLAIAPALLIAGPAAAADPEWTVDLGAATRVRPAHLGSVDSVTDVVPVIEASYGDRLNLSFDDGLSWAAVRKGPFSFGPVAEYRQSYNDNLPLGAFHMPDTVELGAFAQARTPVGIVEARLRRAVNGYKGWSGDLAFDTGGRIAPKTLLGAELRASWADSQFTQEYFGLKPYAAHRSGLPRFLDEDYLTVGGQVTGARELTPKIRMFVQLSADRIVGELGPTPLLRTRDQLTALVGITYHWTPSTSGHVP